MCPIAADAITVTPDVVGERWRINDPAKLHTIIANVALGQSLHARRIIAELSTHNRSGISDQQLFDAARDQLRATGTTPGQRQAAVIHRDAFLFECIAWTVATLEASKRAYSNPPHLKSTMQGLDGFTITLHATKAEIDEVLLVECKCTVNPRKLFRDEIMTGFQSHHNGDTKRELLAAATTLLSQSNLTDDQVLDAVDRIFDVSYRYYRAALTVQPTDSPVHLFRNYEQLQNLQPSQRIAAMFEVNGDLRDWFETLSESVISALDALEDESVV